jgi:hypothetical protein
LLDDVAFELAEHRKGRDPVIKMMFILAIWLLGISVTACGGRSQRSTGAASETSSHAVQSATTLFDGNYSKNDADKDSDDENLEGIRPHQDYQSLLAPYPNRLSPIEQRTIGAVIKRYYEAAVVEDGINACKLFAVSLLKELDGEQKHRDRKSCIPLLDLLFKENHNQFLADDFTKMVVSDARVDRGLGIALLGFRTAPEGAILIKREGPVWKINELLPSQIP